MTVVRVKGFQIFKDRHGRMRCYHRKSGIAVDLVKCPMGSAEFFAECARISALLSTVAPKPGTLGLLIHSYRADAISRLSETLVFGAPDFPSSLNLTRSPTRN